MKKLILFLTIISLQAFRPAQAQSYLGEYQIQVRCTLEEEAWYEENHSYVIDIKPCDEQGFDFQFRIDEHDIHDDVKGRIRVEGQFVLPAQQFVNYYDTADITYFNGSGSFKNDSLFMQYSMCNTYAYGCLVCDGKGIRLGATPPEIQNVEPMVQEGRQWATRVWWAVAPPQLYTEIYRMEGDTVLDQKTYKKIYCYLTEDLSDGALYHYALRQDGDKVYFKSYDGNGETLFFDFSIEQGESISVHGHEFVVAEVYDTVLSDGKTRKAIRLSDVEMTDIWVEGVGSLVYGINWDGLRLVPGAKKYDLLCCHQNEAQIYQASQYGGNCFVGEAPPGVSTEKTQLNPAAFWRLSPQPASESVRAVCEATADGVWREGRWRLIDAAGKALQVGVFTDGCFEIGLEACPAGLYFVEITAADVPACRLKCLKATR